MTNLGSVVNNGNGTGSCNATPPPNSACPPPVIGRNFYASPAPVGPGMSTTLTWSAANASACKIDGDNGFSNVGGSSGSVSTGPLASTTTFTLTCQNGGGGPETSASVRVAVDPHYQEI
ncbi:MAG: hypothetical protein KGI70_01055 [Patescibacteria group bacterium]|nr:hypothetical protein [Patescibacteria group bacterium]